MQLSLQAVVSRCARKTVTSPGDTLGSGRARVCWLLVGSYLGEESTVHLLGYQLAVSVKAVSVGVCDHPGLGMACIALDCLDIALAQF